MKWIETDQEHIQRLNKQAGDYQARIVELEAKCARLRRALQDIADHLPSNGLQTVILSLEPSASERDWHKRLWGLCELARAALAAQPNRCEGGCDCDPTSIHDCVCPECRARFIAVQQMNKEKL